MVGLLAYLVECSPPAISTLVLYPCRLRFRPPSRSCSALTQHLCHRVLILCLQSTKGPSADLINAPPMSVHGPARVVAAHCRTGTSYAEAALSPTCSRPLPAQQHYHQKRVMVISLDRGGPSAARTAHFDASGGVPLHGELNRTIASAFQTDIWYGGYGSPWSSGAS